MKPKVTIEKVATLTGVARMLGETISRVDYATSKGQIDCVELACGARVIVVDSAKKWHTTRRQVKPVK